MFDLDEIYRRVQRANEQAAQTMQELEEKAEQAAPKEPEPAREEKTREDDERRLEILGQEITPEQLAQMAEDQARLRESIQLQVAAAAAEGVQSLLQATGSEEMGLLVSALETLMLEEDEGEEDEETFEPETEEQLCALLEETMARIEALPEPDPVFYDQRDPRWQRFGVLLSGLISTLNGHRLDGIEVEQHLPVLEQQVASLVRRSWGIGGRGELLEMIRYLSQEGYQLRYQMYAQAQDPGELMEDGDDVEERENIARTWRFVQRYRQQYGPAFLTGWDVGRAAMLTRWGCYLGWITESEATGILHHLSQRAQEELCSWRQFARSYLFGGLMWKLLCGDNPSSVSSYLGYLADAASRLIAGQETGGEWGAFPWPARRKIGF